jgi:hypothetical protein
MSTYTLEVTHVQNWGALNEYLTNNCTYYDSFNQTGTTLNINTKYQLSQAEYEDMINKINAYRDPTEWLQLASVEDMQMHTHSIKSTEIEDFNTFINSYQKPDATFLDSIKTIFECATDDVQQFLNYTPSQDPNQDVATIQLYDLTRGIVVKEVQQSLEASFAHFKQLAQDGKTGHQHCWHSLQLYSLKNSMPNYDCIWQFRGCRQTSFTDVGISLQGIQKLYYYSS